MRFGWREVKPWSLKLQKPHALLEITGVAEIKIISEIAEAKGIAEITVVTAITGV